MQDSIQQGTCSSLFHVCVANTCSLLNCSSLTRKYSVINIVYNSTGECAFFCIHHSSCTFECFIFFLHLHPLPPAAHHHFAVKPAFSRPTLFSHWLRSRRLKRRMQSWERHVGTVYLHSKGLYKFRGKPLRVSPSYFHRPPPPQLAEIYKEQKIRPGREGGWYAQAEIERRT